MLTSIETKPRFTDMHRYPTGYRPSFDTDIRRTFERFREATNAQARPRDARWPVLAAI